MTHKVNPSLFRIGINKGQDNFLYIDKNINQKITPKIWLFLLDFLKKTIFFLIHYSTNNKTLNFKNLEKNLYKKKEYKFSKNEKQLTTNLDTTYTHTHFIHPLKLYHKNNIYKYYLHSNKLVKGNKQSTFINIIINSLDITLYIFDQYLNNTILNNKKNLTPLEKKIDWLSLEKNIQLEIKAILTSYFPELTKNNVFNINFNIHFIATPYSFANIHMKEIQKELEDFKPQKLPQIFKNALYKSKKKRSSKFKTTNISGMKIRITGRLNGAERARSKFTEYGRLSIKSCNSILDYDYGFAKTKYGILGIKIWIDQGQSILWKNNTLTLNLLKKNIIIPSKKRYKKIKFKHFISLQYIVNFFLDTYQYQEHLENF